MLTSKATREANYGADPVVRKIDNPEKVIFEITDTNLYVPVVTLSKENDTHLLEQLKSEFTTTIKWKKFRSQMTVQPQDNNLNYLIEPIFINVKRLFVLSFARTNADDNKDTFSDYYVSNIEIKAFNVLIDGKSFFHSAVKNVEDVYKKIIERSNNNDYTNGNLLDFAYFKEHYKLIAIDCSKQTKLKDPQ